MSSWSRTIHSGLRRISEAKKGLDSLGLYVAEVSTIQRFFELGKVGRDLWASMFEYSILLVVVILKLQI